MAYVSEEDMQRARNLLDSRDAFQNFTFATSGIVLDEGLRQALELIKTERKQNSQWRALPTSQMQIESPSRGCIVDHADHRYARTMHRKSHRYCRVLILEDSGSMENWIHPAVVDQLALQITALTDSRSFQGFSGPRFDPIGEVTLTLLGIGRNSIRVSCLIGAEEFPFDGITLGKNFIKERRRHVHEMFSDQPHEGAQLLVVAKKATPEETSRTSERRDEMRERNAERARNQEEAIRKNIRANSQTSSATSQSSAQTNASSRRPGSG